MIITFVLPNVKCGEKHKFFRIEPTIFAKLKALTPDNITCKLFDTRIENIDYDAPTDLVAISTTTFSAKNAYEIANEYRKRGVKVVIGGVHADLCKEDVIEHADAVMVGEAETIWEELIQDFSDDNLKKVYVSDQRYDMKNYKLDYSIFKGKHYLPFHIIETSRGCKFNCSFCSLTPLYKQQVSYRPIDEIVEQIKNIKDKYLFFIDDNFGSDKERTIDLLKRLIPLKKKWFAQISVNYLQDREFVELLHKSGCINIFIGFESINPESLKSMNKMSNLNLKNYEIALNNCVNFDISINGGFVSGALTDTLESVHKTFEFANSFQFLLTSFINLMPFPGTPLYEQLKKENKLLYEKWWLEDISFSKDPIYFTDNISAEEMTHIGMYYYNELYKFKNIFKRFWNSKYKIKMRFLILFMNLYLKYFGKSTVF